MAETVYPHLHEEACTGTGFPKISTTVIPAIEHMDIDLSTINDRDRGRRSDMTNAGDDPNTSRPRDNARDLYSRSHIREI